MGEQNRVSSAASEKDMEGIRSTILDFIEGWYEGDVERRERCFHPKSMKRIVHKDPETGGDRLEEYSALQEVQFTRAGRGRDVPKDMQRKDFEVFDATERSAVAKVNTSSGFNYLLLSKFNGQWVIMNALWEKTTEG